MPLPDLSAYSGHSIRTLRGFLVRGHKPLPHYKIGKKITVRRSDFDAWALEFRIVGDDRVAEMADDIIKGLV